MSYMSDIEDWITQLFACDDEEIRRQIKAKLLESFRNGQKACPTCRPRRQALRVKVPVSA